MDFHFVLPLLIFYGSITYFFKKIDSDAKPGAIGKFFLIATPGLSGCVLVSLFGLFGYEFKMAYVIPGMLALAMSVLLGLSWLRYFDTPKSIKEALKNNNHRLVQALALFSYLGVLILIVMWHDHIVSTIPALIWGFFLYVMGWYYAVEKIQQHVNASPWFPGWSITGVGICAFLVVTGFNAQLLTYYFPLALIGFGAGFVTGFAPNTVFDLFKRRKRIIQNWQ